MSNHEHVKEHPLESSEHQYKCDTCDLTFKTELKLRDHICKVEISNPKYATLYMKGWYNANGCTPVYCSKQSTDIAWLHCENCDLEECASYTDKNIEDRDVENLKLECFVKILWSKLLQEVN